MKSLSHLKILLREGTREEHPISMPLIRKIVISAANTDITGERLKEILLEKYKIRLKWPRLRTCHDKHCGYG